MFNLLNRPNKILPDVWEDDIDIISVNRDQVGDNKGGGGPDDQKHGQKAQSLHLGQMCDLQKSRAAQDKRLRLISHPGRLMLVVLYRQSHGDVNKVKERERERNVPITGDNYPQSLPHHSAWCECDWATLFFFPHMICVKL